MSQERRGQDRGSPGPGSGFEVPASQLLASGGRESGRARSCGSDVQLRVWGGGPRRAPGEGSRRRCGELAWATPLSVQTSLLPGLGQPLLPDPNSGLQSPGEVVAFTPNTPSRTVNFIGWAQQRPFASAQRSPLRPLSLWRAGGRPSPGESNLWRHCVPASYNQTRPHSPGRCAPPSPGEFRSRKSPGSWSLNRPDRAGAPESSELETPRNRVRREAPGRSRARAAQAPGWVGPGFASYASSSPGRGGNETVQLNV